MGRTFQYCAESTIKNQCGCTRQTSTDRVNVLLDEFPTVMETRKAVQQLSSGKGPGADAVPVEVYKAGGSPWQRI